MTPVFQDKFGEEGNCEQAAVASILGLSLHEVPNFNEFGADFNKQYRQFLRTYGFVPVVLEPIKAPDCFYLAVGASIVTGRPHVCIYRKGKLVHDPHPGRDGLSEVREIHLIVPVEIDLGKE